MKKTRYPEEFKREAVRLVLDGPASSNQISRELGIGQPTLSKWVRQPSSNIHLIELSPFWFLIDGITIHQMEKAGLPRLLSALPFLTISTTDLKTSLIGFESSPLF